MYSMFKRIFDIFFAMIAITLLSPLFLFISLAIKYEDRGSVIYWSNRVGREKRIFRMPKFRTMLIDSPQVATHLLENPNVLITKVGFFLRRYSIDELPQLWSILIGDMSFVGPRPALFNQYDLIQMRSEKGIDSLKPGLTGWAQINGFRGSNPTNELMRKRMEYDLWYMNNWSNWLDFYIILKTFFIIFTKPKR